MIADIWFVVWAVWVIVGGTMFSVYSLAWCLEDEKRVFARVALTGLFLPIALPFWLAVLLWLILKGLFVSAFSKES